MKKILVTLLVAALVAPAMAIEFTATDMGAGQLRVNYTLTAGEVLRGMALKISVTSGDAVVSATDDVVIPVGTFNTFIDYAFTTPTGYDVGVGHCLANPAAAGVLDLAAPKAEFVVSLGYLDQGGAQAGLTVDSFFDVFFDMSANSAGTITADSLRGGIVGDSMVATTTLPLAFALNGECYTGPQYAEWVAVGKPDCWCSSNNPRQCKGDVDGLYQGKQFYYVSTNDLAILLAAWNKPIAALTGDQICADLDHLAQGKQFYRVSTNDLAIMLANWNINNGPAPTCP